MSPNTTLLQKKLYQEHTNSHWKSWAIFAGVSGLLHFPIILVVAFLLTRNNQEVKPSNKFIEIQNISDTRAQRLQRRKKARSLLKKRKKKRAEKKKKKKKKEEKLKGQVVDVAPTPDSRKPKKYKFLSQYNTRVKKQTISRHRRLKYKLAMKTPTRTRRAKQPKKVRLASKLLTIISPNQQPFKYNSGKPKKNKTRKRKPTKRKRKRTSPKKGRKLPKRTKKSKRILVKDKKKGKYRNSKERFPLPGNGKKVRLAIGPLKMEIPSISKEELAQRGKEQQALPNIINLKPDQGTLSRIQGAPAPDHVKGIKEGEETLLNSRRWKYASFFNRVKRLVAQHWSPVSPFQRRDPYGNVYGVKDRYTLLTVVLFKDGKLKEIKVKRSSGIRFLDKEAIRSFKKAQPFPNPPKALSGADGNIRFSFGFTLQLSGRRGFSLFR